MNDTIYRVFRPEDRTALLNLWSVSFGDSDELISGFYSVFLKDRNCYVAEQDGQVVSSLFLLPDYTLFPYRRYQLKAAYLYAVCTLPELRGQGIGSALVRYAYADKIQTHDLILCLPASERLYDYYKRLLPFTEMGTVRETVLTSADLADVKRSQCARIPTTQYLGLREAMLSGMPHLMYSPDGIDYLEAMFEESPDHGFYILENGVAAVEMLPDGACRIDELLAPGMDFFSAVAALAAFNRADTYIVRTPEFFEAPGNVKRFMLAAFNQKPDCFIPDDLWFGLALD